jgi:hypothetical protein
VTSKTNIQSFMKVKAFILLTVLTGVSITVSAQDISGPNLQESVYREVVQRILAYKFKATKREKVVLLAEKGLKETWLPVIKNVKFRLLTEGEIEDLGRDVFFFTETKANNGGYDIALGFGNPNCDYIGDGWRFRISDTGTRLWPVGSVGGGCGGGYSVGEPGALNTYPNELKGYRFFDVGKLKALELTISDREDVKRNFDGCDDQCSYDKNWDVRFSYFGDISFEKTIDNRKIMYVARPELVGKLSSISLKPKSVIQFGAKIFPQQFQKHYAYSAGHDGKGGGTNTSYFEYVDRYGLDYSVLDRITLTTKKDLSWTSGELMSIDYAIPEKLEEKMLVETK